MGVAKIKAKGLEILEPEALGTDASLLCMHGPASNAVWPDSVNGQCAECGRAIHYAATASLHIQKICAKCMLPKILDAGCDPRFAVTETTLEETLSALGLEDTPELRAHLQLRFKDTYLNFLREQARRIDDDEEHQ